MNKHRFEPQSDTSEAYLDRLSARLNQEPSEYEVELQVAVMRARVAQLVKPGLVESVNRDLARRATRNRVSPPVPDQSGGD